MKTFVCWAAKDVEQDIKLRLQANDEEGLRKLQQKLDFANEIWKSWVMANAGSMVALNGASGTLEIPAPYLKDIPALQTQYGLAIGSEVKIGIGFELSEAQLALKVAGHGRYGTVVLYDDGVQATAKEIEEGDKDLLADLGKAAEQSPYAPMHGGPASATAPVAEGSEHSDAEAAMGEAASAAEGAPPPPEMTHAGQALEDQFHYFAQKQGDKDGAAPVEADHSEIKKQVAEVLKMVRGQAPILGQMKQAAPDAYNAVMGLVQSVIQMGKELTASPEGLKKAEGDIKDHIAPQPTSAVDAKSPEFQNWFAGSRVVHPTTKEPLRVFHGTTHDFSEFSNKKGNPENFFGRAHYFTDNPSDLGANYATTTGPDLTNRIESEAEKRADYSDKPKFAAVKERVAQKLTGPGPRSIPAYLHMKNPLVIQPGGGTRFEYNEEVDDNGDYTGKVSGNGVNLINAIHKTVKKYQKYDPSLDASKIIGHIMEKASLYDYPTAHDIDQAMRDNPDLMDMYSKSGSMSNEFNRDVWKAAGHDGIIMDASRFSTMPGTKGTRHYVVFDPRQIKSAISNTGAFDPKSKDFGKEEFSMAKSTPAIDPSQYAAQHFHEGDEGKADAEFHEYDWKLHPAFPIADLQHPPRHYVSYLDDWAGRYGHYKYGQLHPDPAINKQLEQKYGDVGSEAWLKDIKEGKAPDPYDTFHHFDAWAKKPEEFPPLLIQTKDGKYRAKDGNHRVGYAAEKGMSTLPAIVGTIKQPLDKAALPMPSASTKHKITLPTGTVKQDGKVKVEHGDGKTGWISARAGAISAVADRHAKPVIGQAAHPASSRNPTTR